MRLEDMNWFDVESYLERDDRLIVVLGSCEQHGYLSLLTDVRIPQALAEAASQQTGVLVSPPLNFGASPYFLKYPGTISLRVSTLLDLVEDLVRSAYGQGFRRILVMNGHGGNDASRGRLYELANQLSDLKLVWYAWWQSPSVAALARKYNLKQFHANWQEAFSFTKVSPLPDGEKAPIRHTGLMGAEQSRQTYGDGVFGGRYSVGSDIMDELFAVVLGEVLGLLQFE